MPRRKTIPKILKDLTWQKWIGDDIAKAKCLCCGVNDIKMNSFHCGHVIAEADGGPTTVDNLRPVCATCNLSMRTQNMLEFKGTHALGNVISSEGTQGGQRAQGAAISINENRIQASTIIGSTSVSLSVPLKHLIKGIHSLF